MSEKAENEGTRPIKDIAVVVIVTLVGSVLMIALDALERFYALTRAWEQWEIDEVIFIFVVLSFSLLWFSYRRWKASLAEVDKRKRVEERLLKAKEHAEEMSRLKSAFLSNMSHEIRTPLTSIIGFAAILANEIPEPQREFIHHIEESGQRLLRTLNSVLDFSKLEAGKLLLSSEPLNVSDEVQQQVALLRPLADRKGLSLRVLTPGAEATARLDRAGFQRILNHLIGNAIKFTKRGEVVVEVCPVAECIEIRVADTGVGMSAEFQRRLFEAFKQESIGMSRLYEGAGLGLTITKRLVDLMEGTIRVASKKGQGSTFTVSFPQVVPLAVTRDRPSRAQSGLAQRAAGQVPVRVLALDDNPAMLVLLERYLKDSIVDTATDEEEILTLARQHLYDAVLLDINLGGARDGVEVLRELRMLPGYERVPAVAVTAYAMPRDKEHFLTAGFDAYLSKPFTEDELHDVLARVTTP